VQPTRCTEERPPLRPFGDSAHLVACHWAEQIRAGEIKPVQREVEFVEHYASDPMPPPD
jgi:peptide/nickel transport system ATP-binding protein